MGFSATPTSQTQAPGWVEAREQVEIVKSRSLRRDGVFCYTDIANASSRVGGGPGAGRDC
nr:MAG TPA: hypothetical protein [Caudoviricetes sp.]